MTVRVFPSVLILSVVLLLTACQTIPEVPPGAQEWQAVAFSNTGRKWGSKLFVFGDKYRGTIRCDPFGDLNVFGTIESENFVSFGVNEGRRDIPAMGGYMVRGKFPTLGVFPVGTGACGTAKLEYTRVRP